MQTENKLAVVITMLIAILSLGSLAEAGNATITITKPGIAVYRWGVNVSTDYLPNGGLRVGTGTNGYFCPVYRFEIPRLGTISGLQVRITATEHGPTGTEIYFGSQKQDSYEKYVTSLLYTAASSSDIDLWISGESDSDFFTDYIEITFDNIDDDDIEIFELAVTIEYANISDSNVDLIAKYQLLCNLRSILTTYETEMGPVLGNIVGATNEDLFEEGVQKSFAVADSLSKINGFDISGLSVNDWGSWIATAKNIKSGLS